MEKEIITEQFYKVSEATRKLNTDLQLTGNETITESRIRNYDDEDLVEVKRTDNKKGRSDRLYSERDIIKLRLITAMFGLRFEKDEIKAFLDNSKDPQLVTNIINRVNSTRKFIAILEAAIL